MRSGEAVTESPLPDTKAGTLDISSGGEAQAAIKGGRVRFYTWASHIKDILAE
jgi:hypothetical protein